MTGPSNIDLGIETLELFNDRVSRVLRSGFVEFARTRRIGFSVRSNEDGETVEIHGPSEDQRDALLYTLRLFYQGSDGISIRQIGALYQTLPISSALADRFAFNQGRLNKFLDSEDVIVGLSYREAFELSVYGRGGHLDRDKRRRLAEWASDPVRSAAVDMTFNGAIVRLVEFLIWARKSNDSVIRELRG